MMTVLAMVSIKFGVPARLLFKDVMLAPLSALSNHADVDQSVYNPLATVTIGNTAVFRVG
jgi:hypothetical protein